MTFSCRPFRYCATVSSKSIRLVCVRMRSLWFAWHRWWVTNKCCVRHRLSPGYCPKCADDPQSCQPVDSIHSLIGLTLKLYSEYRSILTKSSQNEFQSYAEKFILQRNTHFSFRSVLSLWCEFSTFFATDSLAIARRCFPFGTVSSLNAARYKLVTGGGPREMKYTNISVKRRRKETKTNINALSWIEMEKFKLFLFTYCVPKNGAAKNTYLITDGKNR